MVKGKKTSVHQEIAHNSSSDDDNDTYQDNDSDSGGEWETVQHGKQAKMKELQLKRQKKADELKAKRDRELQEHKDRKQKIADMFSNPNSYHNKWDVLSDNVDDSELLSHEEKKKKKQQTRDGSIKKDGEVLFVYNNKLVKDNEKKKKEAERLGNEKNQQKQLQQQKEQQRLKELEKSYPNSLDQAKDKFDFDKYYELMVNVEKKYPNVHDIQLKYVAESLETYFGHVLVDYTTLAPQLLGKKIDFPISYFEQKFITETVNFLEKKPIVNIVPAIQFLINNLLQIINQEKNAIKSSGLGILLLLQIIFKYLPNISIHFVDQFKTFFNINTINQLKPNIAALYLWLLIQPLSIYPHVTITSWFGVLLPLYLNPHVKVSASIMDHIRLFTLKVFDNNKIKSGKSIDTSVLVSSTEQFLWAIQKEYKLSDKTQGYCKVLFNVNDLFPSKKVSKEYFNVLIGNTAIGDTEYRDLVIHTIVGCLAMDKRCFDWILEDLLKNVAQVNNIFLFISLHITDMQLLSKLNAEKMYMLGKSVKEQLTELMNNKTKKKNLPRNVEINDIEMCLISIKPVMKEFKTQMTLNAKRSGGGSGTRSTSVASVILSIIKTVVYCLLILSICVGVGYYVQDQVCVGGSPKRSNPLVSKYITLEMNTYICDTSSKLKSLMGNYKLF